MLQPEVGLDPDGELAFGSIPWDGDPVTIFVAPSEQEFPRSLLVQGEKFLVEVPGEDGDWVHLIHPKWSVMGSGSTIQEAETDLRAEARGFAEIVAGDDPSEYTPEGRRQRAFVLKFLDSPLRSR